MDNRIYRLFSLLLIFAFPSISQSIKAVEPSGTLPVIIINTENNSPIKDKKNYIKAHYRIDPKSLTDVQAFEGELQIRGRGNYTWEAFEKKPYRIKLDEKTPLLGFKKSKHFVLLAHADDNLGFLREPLGFKLSELSGLDWTPGQKPVELILNGDYKGLYFLVENIRIDKNRVNIFDQEDENPSTDVSGGWLCELDNYEESPEEQIDIKEGNGDIIRITHHSPEIINEEQEIYLRNQMEALDRVFYIKDENSREYEKLVDLKSLSSFYVLQELMDGQESFHGSCYLYHDRGWDKKWVWGPVWDFGNTYMRQEGLMIYERPDWGQTWLDQIVKFKSFQEAYKERFIEFLDNDYDQIKSYIIEFATTIAEAGIADAKRWPQYGNPDISSKANDILNKLKSRISFLGNKWGIETNVGSGLFLRGDFNNWTAQPIKEFESPVEGTYIYEGESFSGRFKIADSEWGKNNWGASFENQEIPLDTPVEIINGPGSKNMIAAPGFKSVIFKVLVPGEKATVTLSSANAGNYELKIDSKADFHIIGNEVSIDYGVMSVYTTTGRCVAKDVSHITLDRGIYILKSLFNTKKIAIK